MLLCPPVPHTPDDFDTGEARFEGSEMQREAWQIDSQARLIETAPASEVITNASWPEFLGATWPQYETGLSTLGPNARAELTTAWNPNHVYSATTYGVGDDNPASAYLLTQQQAARAVMVLFEGVSSFQVRPPLPVRISPTAPHPCNHLLL